MPRGGHRPGSGPQKGAKYKPRAAKEQKPAAIAKPKKEKVSAKEPEVKSTDGLVTVMDAPSENLTPLEYMLRTMNDPSETAARRAWAAQSAAPYCHSRKGEGNKKEERGDKAKAAGTGKFAASPPPLRVIK